MKCLVTCCNWNKEVEVNSTLFESIEDCIIEAATLAVDICIKKEKKDGAVVITVKTENKEYVVNSYKILCNCGLYKQAEILRKFALQEYKNDLRNEKILMGV